MSQPVPPTDVTQPPEPVVVEELTPLEAAFYAMVLAALAAWLSSVLAKVLAPWRLYRMAPDPQALWSLVPAWNREVRVLVTWLHDNAAEAGWDRWFDDQDGDEVPEYPSTNAHIAAHLAMVENYLVRIPEEVFNLIIADVVDGHNDGESLEEIAERIENTLTVTGSENWPARARTISVTEVNGTANAGWFAAGLRTEELLGVPQWKQWLESHDEAVRTEHRTDQKRPLREPFLIGGELLMYPGAKNGSAWNIIGCRCAARSTEAPSGTRIL
jgi:hypothetical protein